MFHKIHPTCLRIHWFSHQLWYESVRISQCGKPGAINPHCGVYGLRHSPHNNMCKLGMVSHWVLYGSLSHKIIPRLFPKWFLIIDFYNPGWRSNRSINIYVHLKYPNEQCSEPFVIPLYIHIHIYIYTYNIHMLAGSYRNSGIYNRTIPNI